ncbi:MAG: hypothetical protein ABFC56_06860 [Clostridiaceae bacterium]
MPVDHVDLARSLCATLAGDGGTGMFTTALSPTGTEPATHWISSGLIEDAFADLLPLLSVDVTDAPLAGHPDHVCTLAHDAGMAVSYDDIVRLFSAVDVSAQPPNAALERLGLALSNEDSLT